MQKIQEVNAWAVDLPLSKVMHLGSERIAHAHNVFVRIVDDSGRLGWGEAASAPTMTGETQPGMLRCIHQSLSHELIGKQYASLDELEMRLAAVAPLSPAARAAVTMALHDLRARQLDVPLWHLFGDMKRRRIPALYIVGGGTLAQELAESRQACENGFRHLKIKVGVNDPQTDAERVVAIRQACAREVLISADVNMAWTPVQAEAFVREVGGVALEYLEQPVDKDDVAGMRYLSGLGRLEIAADEGLHGLKDIETHIDAGVTWYGLKLIKLGGYGAMKAASSLCFERGVKTILACKIAESSLAIAAMAHWAATEHRVDTGVSFSHTYLASDIVGTPLRIRDGFVEVPDGPGIGLVPDAGLLEKFSNRSLR